jgi:hypothetical protein
MPEQKNPGIRFYLPFIVPMAVNFIGSAWVLVAARRARNGGACGIPLPWDKDTSYVILGRLFTAALEEAETFKAVTSACIADLHADITSAYIIVLIVAALSGLFTLKFTRYPIIPWNTKEHDKYFKGILAGFGLALICIPIYFLSTYVTDFVDFSGEVRRMIHVKDGYVSLISYWFAIFGLGFMLIFTLFLLYYSINSLHSLLKHKRNSPRGENG